MLALLYPGLVPNKHNSTYQWLSTDDYASDLVSEAESILGPNLLERHKNAEIYDWDVYQAVYMIESLSLSKAWCRLNEVAPDIIAGQSFGSLVAAVASESIPFVDMCKIMVKSTVAETSYFADVEEPLGCVFFSRCSELAVREIISDIDSLGSDGWLDISVVQERGVMAVSGYRNLISIFVDRLKSAGGIVFYTIDRAEHCPALAPLANILAEEVYTADNFVSPVRPVISDNGTVLRTGAEVGRDLAIGWSRRLINEEQYTRLDELGVDHVAIPGHSSLFKSDRGITGKKTLIKAKEMLSASM